MTEEKIIMYDSPEAAQEITLTGWVSGGDHRFWYKDEHMARWSGCTHMKCECGNIRVKHWLICDECRHKKELENYLKLPYKEWDGVEYVIEPGGDKFFWSQEELEEYMEENNIEEIALLICEPMLYQEIDSETVASDAHEDWEPEPELEKAIEEFNKVLQTLKPHSWTPGKIRTNHKLNQP